jgi:photosystem II stability/assembly factor-like uncharacterized protein
MKRFGLVFSVLLIMTGIISSCSKKSNNSSPAERNKYAWVAGQVDSTGYGQIFFSADSGETWVRQGEGIAALKNIDVNDIWAVDENNIWAIGSGNSILKTIDGGKTWIRLQAPVNQTSGNLLAISIVNKTNIWISGSGGTVYNSADNGNTWKMFDTTFFHVGLMQGIWAITPQKVYVVGGIGVPLSRGFIACTLNGGVTWDSVSPANNYNIHEWIGAASYGNTIVVYGGRAHYIVSIDGGLTWMNDSVPGTGGISGADVNHLVMLNSLTWWGAFDLGEIFLTKDGGTTWASQQTGQTGEYLVGIDAWDSQLALAVGMAASWPKTGPILRTSNGGTNWITKMTSTANLYKVSFIKQ